MPRVLRSLALALSLMFCAASRADLLVLHGVTVIDGTGAPPLERADVVVDGEQIAAVEPRCVHPDGATVIDAAGLWLLPGFIDMHVHLLEHGRDEKGSIPARVDWDLVRRSLRLLLDHGVLTVRDAGSETEAAVTLRRMLRDGNIAGPRLLTAGRIINASSFNPEPFQPVASAGDVRREIRWQKAAGVDFVKIYSAMPPELTRVAIEEARAAGLPVIGHLHRTTWTDAARLGIDFITHAAPWTPDLLPLRSREAYAQTLFGRAYWLEQLDLESPEVDALVRQLAERRVVIDPTLIAMHTKFFGNDPRWLANPDNSLLPDWLVAGWKAGSFTRDWTAEQYREAQKSWPKMLAFTRLLFERGVRLTVGTDSPTAWIVPGAGFHDELSLLRDAGIPELAILKMATYDAAVALGIGGQTGAVRPGLSADLILLERNPLDRIENTRAIAGLMQRGRWIRALAARPAESERP